MTSTVRLAWLTLAVVLAGCKGIDGGGPVPRGDAQEREFRAPGDDFERIGTVDDEPFVYNDNVFVLPVAESLARVRLPVGKYTATFYGEWLVDENGVYRITDSRHLIFTAGQLRIYTAEDLVAEHGERVPAYPHSQRNFRAAAILLIDEDHPAVRRKLHRLSEDVSWFSEDGPGGLSLPDGRRVYNFFGATGGRAMIEMDDLLRFNTRIPVAGIHAQVSSASPSP